MNFEIDPRKINLQGPDGMQLIKLLRGLIADIESGGDEPEPGEDSELFYCTYGTTTYSEIQNALAEDKVPICIRDGLYYYLVNTTQNRYVFACYNPTNNYIYAVRCLTDRWDNVTFMLQERLTWDYAPTQGSTRPVTSGGVWTAIQNAGESDIDPYQQYPEMDGVASPGSSDEYARGDHVHPTDTSRAAVSDIPTKVSDLQNDSGFVNQNQAAYAAPVQSVNGQTGAVTVQPATDEQVSTAVNTWLGNNVTQETGYVLDASLSVNNAAAPADKAGEIKSALVKTPQTIEWTIGGLNDNGTEAASTSRLRSNYIRVFNGSVIRISNPSYANGIYSMVLAFNTDKVKTDQLLANTLISIGNSLTLKADFDGYVRIRHFYKYDPTITDALFDLASTMYTVYTNEVDLDTQYRIDELESDYNYTKIASVSDAQWTLGSLNDNGSVGASTSRIVSDYIQVFANDTITIEPNYANGIYVLCVLYEKLENNTYRKSGIFNRTLYENGTKTVLTVPYGCYIRIGAYYRYDPALTDDSKSALEKMITTMVSPILSGLDERISTVEELIPFDAPDTVVINNRDLQGNNTIMFAWASDTHHQVHSVSETGATSGVLSEMATVAQDVKVDFLAITGDLVNGYYPVNEQKTNLADVVNIIRGKYNYPVMFAEGNHDDNSWYASANGSSGSSPTGLSQVLTNDQFTNYAMNNSLEEFVFNEADPLGGYYYKDFTKVKIRVIVLNVEDIPYLENQDLTLKYYGQWTMGFRQAQLDWMANKALKFNSTGWGVILLLHNDSNMTGNSLPVINMSNLNEILNGFTSKSSGTTTSTETDFTLTVSYDFTANKSDEIVAWFSGHVHRDSNEIINGVPHITIINTFNETSGGYDIVTVDRSARRIYTKRYNGEAMPTYNRIISW